MMEDTKKRLSVVRYPETVLAVTTVWSPLLLGLYYSPSLLHSDVSMDEKIISVPFSSAAGRSSGLERTARAQTRG